MKKRYLKKTTIAEISELWGFTPSLSNEYRNKQLYLVLRKDGQIHKHGGGRYLSEDELRETDIIL